MRVGSGWLSTLGGASGIARLEARKGLLPTPAKAPAPVPDALRQQLEQAGFPGKAVARHGAALEGLTELSARLASAGAGLGHRRSTWNRNVDRAWTLVARALERVPEGERAGLARQLAEPLVELVDRLDEPGLRASGLAAAASLVDVELRAVEQRARPLEALGSAGESAAKMIGELAQRLDGREGVARTLDLVPVLVETLHRKMGPTDAKGRDARQALVGELLSEATPRAGLDLATAAQLAGAFEVLPEGVSAAQVKKKVTGALVALGAEALEETRQLGAGFAGAAQTVLAPVLAALEGPYKTGAHALSERVRGLGEAISGRGGQQVDAELAGAFAGLLEAHADTAQLPAVLEVIERAVLSLPGRRPQIMAALEGERPVAGLAFAIRGEAVPDDLGPLSPLREAALARAMVRTNAASPSARQLAGALGQIASSDGVQDSAERLLRGLVAAQAALSRIQPAAEPELVLGLATAMAELDAPVEAARAQHAANAIALLRRSLPKADLLPLLGPGPTQGGLWAIFGANTDPKHPPQTQLQAVLAALDAAQLSVAKPGVQQQAALHALEMTEALSDFDGLVEIPRAQMAADLTRAFASPKELVRPAKAQGALALRSSQAATFEAFKSSVEGLPATLTASVGLHLSPESSRWLIDRISSARGRDTVRGLRDLVLGAAALGRPELVDAVRTSGSSKAAVSGAIRFVQAELREGRIAQLPVDRLVAGLKAGEDPVAQMVSERSAAALEALGLGALGAEVDPVGLAELQRVAPDIANIRAFLAPGQTHDGIDMHRLSPIFEEVLRSVASGTWPAPKYEGELADTALASLDPQQRALWQEELVTSYGAADAPPADGARDARVLFDGVRVALSKRLSAAALKALTGPEALEEAETKLEGLVAELRGKRKGMGPHRELSKSLGPVRQQVALGRLFALTEKEVWGPSAVFDLLQGASALGHDGHPDLARALEEAARLLGAAEGGGQAGPHVRDEDGLEASLTSCTGGCVQSNGARRWANVGFAANANDKMIRAYDASGRFVHRAIFKLLEAKIGAYEGPVLWLNNTQAHGGGDAPAGEAVLRHALAKAEKMGVPLVSGHAPIAPAATQLGWKTAAQTVEMRVPDNRTGMNFTNYVLGSGQVHDSRAQIPAGQRFWAKSVNLTVAWPPGWAGV